MCHKSFDTKACLNTKFTNKNIEFSACTTSCMCANQLSDRSMTCGSVSSLQVGLRAMPLSVSHRSILSLNGFCLQTLKVLTEFWGASVSIIITILFYFVKTMISHTLSRTGSQVSSFFRESQTSLFPDLISGDGSYLCTDLPLFEKVNIHPVCENNNSPTFCDCFLISYEFFLFIRLSSSL